MEVGIFGFAPLLELLGQRSTRTSPSSASGQQRELTTPARNSAGPPQGRAQQNRLEGTGSVRVFVQHRSFEEEESCVQDEERRLNAEKRLLEDSALQVKDEERRVKNKQRRLKIRQQDLVTRKRFIKERERRLKQEQQRLQCHKRALATEKRCHQQNIRRRIPDSIRVCRAVSSPPGAQSRRRNA